MGGGFDFAIILKSVPYLAEGMVLSFQLALLGISGGIFFGTLLALCRLAPFRFLSFIAGSYVNFFRSGDDPPDRRIQLPDLRGLYRRDRALHPGHGDRHVRHAHR